MKSPITHRPTASIVNVIGMFNDAKPWQIQMSVSIRETDLAGRLPRAVCLSGHRLPGESPSLPPWLGFSMPHTDHHLLSWAHTCSGNHFVVAKFHRPGSHLLTLGQALWEFHKSLNSLWKPCMHKFCIYFQGFFDSTASNSFSRAGFLHLSNTGILD